MVVHCDGKGLDSIPFDVPSQVQLLMMNNNSITTIYPLAFQDLPKVVSINLEQNKLQHIYPIFTNFPDLKWVIFKKNLLTKIDLDHFLKLQKLEYLDLSFNGIESVLINEVIIPPQLLTLDFTGNPLDCCKVQPLINVTNISILGKCHSPTEVNGTDIDSFGAQSICIDIDNINSSVKANVLILFNFIVFAAMLTGII